ncbi:rhodanese-like domain-containing protein [Halomonas sp. BC04]|uniref:rhodanese-like domain-containing protein n=1 Tax=Halomonas sp. BC04 TaxID=1403540 RepID=UPI0003ED6CC4|nr:rhodanese-like domain-containing protein [Halomonas sp. BC04]EWG99919.1 sulfurtransferase [Halomonas sp. BC04]
MTKHSDDFLRLANDARQRITEVSPAEARERVAEGALLLDVRDREEFESGHIDGAMNISRGTLEMRIGEVAPDRQAPIVCHCGGGNRGALAAETLQKMGYTRVVSIEGGLKAYEAEDKS